MPPLWCLRHLPAQLSRGIGEPGRRPNPDSNSVSAPCEACDLGRAPQPEAQRSSKGGAGSPEAQSAAPRRRPPCPRRPLPRPWEGISLPLHPHPHRQQGTCRFRCHVSLLFPAEDWGQGTGTGVFPWRLAEPTRTRSKACWGAWPGPRRPTVALAPGRVRVGAGAGPGLSAWTSPREDSDPRAPSSGPLSADCPCSPWG